MASRVLASVACLCLAPGVAAANGFGLPGLGLDDDRVVRPGYAESYNAYPPEQHDLLGRPVPPPAPEDRPSYRETDDDFPPPGGRYGGGFVEYLMTGGRPEPVAPPAYAAPVYAAPAYAAPTYATPLYPPAAPAYAATARRVRALPRASLPEYAPDQPAASYGAPPS